ncbi:hypothetical protein GCM10023170_084420 [Phytohabitans houttuyneae]|uniref:Uncharacterized protein n=2 Tax=Phytohabitans houttuyneae TaxID=1076126 RepID=A0A6V8KN77_9ACTN|nr:hypothetical protein Phou_063150 [Phytohabitans houttuyneae]
MPNRGWPTSPLDAAERAFTLLIQPPAPIAFDGRGFDGLPDRILPLEQLRRLLLAPATSGGVRDAVWRQLVMRARRDGPAWVVCAVGMALPGLRAAAGQVTVGWRGDTADLDAELLVGFVSRLKTVDLDGPRVCGRLIGAGLRAARRARDAQADPALVRADVAEPMAPIQPWDHPELVLARAVAAGVIDADEANLIAATRLGETTLAQAAARLGAPPSTVGSRRARAERKLAAAITAGDLAFVPLRRPRPPNRAGVGRSGARVGVLAVDAGVGGTLEADGAAAVELLATNSAAVGPVLAAGPTAASLLAAQQRDLGARHRTDRRLVSAPRVRERGRPDGRVRTSTIVGGKEQCSAAPSSDPGGAPQPD